MDFENVLNSLMDFDMLNADQNWSTADLLTAGVVINALEKQVPKEPINVRIYDEDLIMMEQFLIGKCPECGQGVHDDMNFCYNCGQKLKWKSKKSDN